MVFIQLIQKWPFKWPFIVMKLKKMKNYEKGRKTERQEEKMHRTGFTPYFPLSKPDQILSKTNKYIHCTIFSYRFLLKIFLCIDFPWR